MDKKEDLIKILNKINSDEITDFYFHRNYNTGELELNIELHNMKYKREDAVIEGHKEIEYSAFWE